MLIGFTCGAFDLLHAGHVKMLEHCASECDQLIVGLHTDPSIDRPEKNKPIQSVYERFIQLRACRWVNDIIPYDTEHDLNNILAIAPIDRRFVGEEYKDKILTGHEVMKKRNIVVMYTPRLHTYSSSELRERIYAKS